MELPLRAPVGPQSIRVFCGYRLPTLTREAFFKELGDTFMPGTPFTLAPFGLAAYVAATLDPDAGSELPDEAALIVYASTQAYAAVRQHSLAGRMYTHSHAGVFEMARSRGQFPGPVGAPTQLAELDRWQWYVFDRAVDWQYGTMRVVLLSPGAGGSLRPELLATTAAAAPALEAADVDQVIVCATPRYATVWLHSSGAMPSEVSTLGLWPADAVVVRDLTATPHLMIRGDEGVQITKAAAFCFRFMRNPRYFL